MSENEAKTRGATYTRDRNIMEVNGQQSEYWGKIMGAT